MKLILILAIALCLACRAFGQESSHTQAAVDAVKKVEQEFREALLHDDIAALDKILSHDFIRTPPTTPSTTKAQWLELIRSGKQKYLSFDTKEVKYRAYGDTVVVNAVAALRVRVNGRQESDLQLRVLQVWVRQDGKWLLVALQGNQTPSP